MPTTIGGLDIVGVASAHSHPDGLLINVYDALTKHLGIMFMPTTGQPSVMVSVSILNAITGKSDTDIFMNQVDLEGHVLFSAVNYSTNEFRVSVRETDGTLTTLATQASPVPGQTDRSFVSVSGVAVDGDKRLFLRSHDRVSRMIIAVDPQGSRIVLDERTPVPAEGFAVRSQLPG